MKVVNPKQWDVRTVTKLFKTLIFSKALGRKPFVLRNNQCKINSFVGVRKRKQLFHLQYEGDGIAGNELSQLGSHTNR